MRVAVERTLVDLDGAALSWALPDLTDRDAYFSAVLDLLGMLLPADTESYNAVDRATGAVEVHARPVALADDDASVQLLGELPDHPMVHSYLSGSSSEPRRMSDLVGDLELRRTRTYAELLSPWDAHYQLTILTARPSAAAGRVWTFTRSGSDFTDDELDRARRLQPVLVALDRARTDLDLPAPEVIDLDAPRPPIGSPDLLTPREAEVLGHVARGLTAEAIGRLLRLSPATVRKHLENTYRKLDVHDRLVAVDRARRLGLISRA